MDISICIPTYNRARMLRQCLDHIAEFKDQSFEVLVGDNASTDDTEATVAEFRSKIPNLTYVRHPRNLGFARNMDSLVRRASRAYVYILNDDDLVFEQALGLAESVLMANPGVSALVGQYVSVRSVDGSMRIDYEDATARVLKQGSYQTLLTNMVFCDGHPFIRREIYERHCAYLDRTGGLMPLYFGLLAHGDLVVVDKPLFQHRTNSDSLSSRMAEAWFLDMTNADLELVVSGCFGALSPEALANAKHQLFHMIYFQAVRMAINQRTAYLVWFFLRRLMALGTIPQELLRKCEYHFIHEFLLDRATTTLSDTEFQVVHHTPSATARALVASLRGALPTVTFVETDPAAGWEGVDMVLCGARAEVTAGASRPPRILALDDMLGLLRLVADPATLIESDGRIGIWYAEAAHNHLVQQPLPLFDLIRAPYSEAEPDAAD